MKKVITEDLLSLNYQRHNYVKKNLGMSYSKRKSEIIPIMTHMGIGL